MTGLRFRKCAEVLADPRRRRKIQYLTGYGNQYLDELAESLAEIAYSLDDALAQEAEQLAAKRGAK